MSLICDAYYAPGSSFQERSSKAKRRRTRTVHQEDGWQYLQEEGVGFGFPLH